jgi:hypothetical protein
VLSIGNKCISISSILSKKINLPQITKDLGTAEEKIA